MLLAKIGKTAHLEFINRNKANRITLYFILQAKLSKYFIWKKTDGTCCFKHAFKVTLKHSCRVKDAGNT